MFFFGYITYTQLAFSLLYAHLVASHIALVAPRSIHPSISSYGSSPLSSLSYRPVRFALRNVPTNRTHDRYLQPISQYLRIDNDQSDLCMASPRNILPLLMSMTTMALPTVLSALSEYECTCERRYVAYVRRFRIS